MATQPLFASDVNTQYGSNVRPILLTNNSAIENSLVNIASCPVGSMPWNREYGSYLMYFLHQPFGERTASRARDSLINSLRRWERRVNILESTNIVPYSDQTLYLITVNYVVLTNEQEYALQFNAEPF